MQQAVEGNGYGRDVTWVLCVDDSDDMYSFFYMGKSKKLTEGHTISVAFMPHGYSTYETTDGGTEWAVSGTIAVVY